MWEIVQVDPHETYPIVPALTAVPGHLPGRHGVASEHVPARELWQATSFSAKVTAPDSAWLAEHWARWHDRPHPRPRYALLDRSTIHQGKNASCVVCASVPPTTAGVAKIAAHRRSAHAVAYLEPAQYHTRWCPRTPNRHHATSAMASEHCSLPYWRLAWQDMPRTPPS